MSNPLTKAEARDILGLPNDAALAAFFGVTRSAVSLWPEAGPIPELRQLQAERKRPELFATQRVA